MAKPTYAARTGCNPSFSKAKPSKMPSPARKTINPAYAINPPIARITALRPMREMFSEISVLASWISSLMKVLVSSLSPPIKPKMDVFLYGAVCIFQFSFALAGM